MKSKTFCIPRYLGLKTVKKIENDLYEIVLGYTEITKKELTLDKEGLSLLEFYLKPHTIDDAVCFFLLDEKIVTEMVQDLNKIGILKETQSSQTYARYDRHLLYYDMVGASPIKVQEKISSSNVGLIGMGGIGNWVSLGLIGSGFKEIRLIDYDTIELSNLTRQVIFDENDISKSKAIVAKEKLSVKNSDTKITTRLLKITSENDLEESLQGLDFVILSADTPPAIHSWLDHVTKKLKIPYLNAGYRDGVGVVGPLTVHGKTSCYECFKLEKDALNKTQNSDAILDKFYERYQAPSFGPINSMVSSIAVLETLKYLGDFGEQTSLDTEISINAINLKMDFVKYKRDLKCWHCGNENINS